MFYHLEQGNSCFKLQGYSYLSDKVSSPALLHCRGTRVNLPLSGGRQISIVKGLASHFSQLSGQRAWRLL